MKWVLRIAGGLVLAWMVIGVFVLFVAIGASKVATSLVEEQTRPVSQVFEQLATIAPTEPIVPQPVVSAPALEPVEIPDMTEFNRIQKEKNDQMNSTYEKCRKIGGMVYYDTKLEEFYCWANGARQ